MLFRPRVALPESDELSVDGAPLAYAIRASARRTLALQILPDGSVRVAAPRRTRLSTIRAFVERHARWVRRKQQELRAHAPRSAPLADGDPLPFLDATLTLRLGSPGSRAHVTHRGAELWVHGSPPQRRAALERWYRRRAAEHAAARIEHYAPLVGRRPRRLSIRGQRTRWGSCSARGTVTLNWRLMQAPAALFDYVLVHELCHLIHRNHSRRFWDEVARVLPDYRERRLRLRTASREFVS